MAESSDSETLQVVVPAKKSKLRKKWTVKTSPESLDGLTDKEIVHSWKWKYTTKVNKFVYTEKQAQKMVNFIELLIGKDTEKVDFFKSLAVPEVKHSSRTLLNSKDVMQVLRKSLVSHDFAMASKTLELLAMENKNRDHVFYKATFQVLENLQNVSEEKIHYFMRYVIGLAFLNKREVLLDLINYNFKKLNFDPPRDIMQKQIPLQKKLRKNAVIDPLVKAYVSLYDYIQWIKFKNEDNESKKEEEIKTRDRFVRVINEVITLPGQWDIFVLKVVEVHEHYDELDLCVEILEKYIESNPEHLHTHIYLYNFLAKHELEEERRSDLLEVISDLSPSDSLVFVYAKQLYNVEEIAKSISLLYLFLDYFLNKNHKEGWQLMGDIAYQLETSPEADVLAISTLKKEWKMRASYWPAYHFDSNTIRDNKSPSDVDLEMWFKKSVFLVCVTRKEDSAYIKIVSDILMIKRPQWHEIIVNVIKKNAP